MKEAQVTLTSKQSRAWRYLISQEDLALLFGGGKGGGKSMLFCLWVDHWLDYLMHFFDMKEPMANPLPVGFIGRKQAVDFRKTTLETWKKIVPPDHYYIRDQDGEIIYKDRLKLLFGGLDDRKNINKFNSFESCFFGIDQAEETERSEIAVLRGSLRLRYKGKQPPYKQFYSANPAECWLKEDFIDNPQPHHYFVPALHKDNPHLPTNYEETMTSAFRYNQGLLDAYLNGNWYALQAENSLLSAHQIAALKDIHRYPKERKGVIVCDPSLGGDACVIKAMENYKTIETKILYVREPMKIAGEMMVMGERHKIPNYAADTTGGLGEAILDRIREVKPLSNRIYLSYASKEDWFRHGQNLRSEMAWNYMMAVIDRRIPYPEDEETRRQILAIRFKVVDSDGHVKLEKKEDTRKRLGQSPDLADAEIMGVWATDQTEPIMSKDAWRVQNKSSEVSSATKSAMAA